MFALHAGIAIAGDTVLDAPLYIHLPKLIIWTLFEGNLSVFIYESYQGSGVVSTRGLPVSCPSVPGIVSIVPANLSSAAVS